MSLAEQWSLYRTLIAARARSQMQYRASFVIGSLTTAAFTLTDFVAIVVGVRHVPNLAGWSLEEVALLFGLSCTAFGLAEMFSAGFDGFHTRLIEGSFDRVLVRPHGAFFQVFASDLSMRRIGRIGQGLVAIAIALSALRIDWTADRVGVVLLGTLSGAAIYMAIFVMGAASAFWTTQGNEVVNIFTNGGNMVTSYPLDAFEGWLRRLLTFGVPLAFVNYYPALYLLGRDDPLGLPGWSRLASPVAAVLMALVAAALWSAGVRRYQSTGT
jgi:ABC-2 type transport system permease protein